MQREHDMSMFKMKIMDDMCGRRALDSARHRLIEKYSPVWRKEMGPLQRLYDGENEIGCFADVYGVAMLCIRSVLEVTKFHKNLTVVIRHDADGPYLWILIGDGCDEYPRYASFCSFHIGFDVGQFFHFSGSRFRCRPENAVTEAIGVPNDVI